MENQIDRFINGLLGGLAPRQRKILTERYGLNGKVRTLQEIGDDFGITRERVRQVENQSLKKIRNHVLDTYMPLLVTAEEQLLKANGIKEDEAFINDIKTASGISDGRNIDSKIRLLFFAAGKPEFTGPNPDHKAFWYLDSASKANFFNTVRRYEAQFEADRKKIIEDKNFVAKLVSAPDFHFTAISRNFGAGPFGDIGLVSWPEIVPKNIKDKAYLAIRKFGKPLHFTDIAHNIHKMGISPERVNIQTVHNELIKDNRFVLVGRGIYGLKEQGFDSGSVKDIVVRLLKNKGPLAQKEIISLVGKQRLLKENTILLSLQNRRYFKRLNDGRLSLREA